VLTVWMTLMSGLRYERRYAFTYARPMACWRWCGRQHAREMSTR
jgi:hypothetical protein